MKNTKKIIPIILFTAMALSACSSSKTKDTAHPDVTEQPDSLE